MDCTQARLLLPYARPGELDFAERDLLESHLESCPECAALFQVERAFDDALAGAVQKVTVPAGLKGRLLANLAVARRPRPWPWVAAAAAVLLTTGGAVYFATRSPDDVDVHQFVSDITRRDTEEIGAWFADRGVEMMFPGRFDHNLLNRYDVAEVQGRRVAHLVYAHTGDGGHRAAVAHVYVLPRTYFQPPDPRVLPDGIPLPTSSHTIEPQTTDNYVYLILYTGGSLAPFTQVAF